MFANQFKLTQGLSELAEIILEVLKVIFENVWNCRSLGKDKQHTCFSGCKKREKKIWKLYHLKLKS